MLSTRFLFSKFLNNLSSVLKHSSSLLFADDFKIFKVLDAPQQLITLELD